jgi:hypothetical protein
MMMIPVREREARGVTTMTTLVREREARTRVTKMTTLVKEH